MSDEPGMDLRERIDAIEKGYEYMIAYAAQGRDTDESGGPTGSSIREYFQDMEKALEGLGGVVKATTGQQSEEVAASAGAFLDALGADAEKARGAIRLILAQSGISSTLVHNLVVSNTMKAVMTDLWIVGEALKRLP